MILTKCCGGHTYGRNKCFEYEKTLFAKCFFEGIFNAKKVVIIYK
jgi:hypothetical protein